MSCFHPSRKRSRKRIAELEAEVSNLQGKVAWYRRYSDHDLNEAAELAAENERLREQFTNHNQLISALSNERDIFKHALEKRHEQLAIARGALRSIAANTCCDTCREAALVAREALQEEE